MHKRLHFFEVTTECNMVEFAEEKIDCYDPDSGKGYFQLTEAVYTSLKTQVLLVKQVSSVNITFTLSNLRLIGHLKFTV